MILAAAFVLVNFEDNALGAASDDSGNCGDAVTYVFTGSTDALVISGSGAMKDYEHEGNAPWYNYMEDITSVTIESGVTTIGSNAFLGCTSLTSVTIPSSVMTIGDYAFSYCTSLTEFLVSSGNPNFSSGDGVLYDKDKTTLIAYPVGKTESSFEIPSSVTTIGGFAFGGCTSLASVAIPSSVTTIGEGAFSDCTSLASVAIGDGVTTIGDYAFDSITFKDENGNTIAVTANNLKGKEFIGTGASTDLELKTGKMIVITFYTQGGIPDGYVQHVDDSSKTLLSFPQPTMEGYSLSGWFTDSEGGEEVTDQTVFNYDSTIFAHWTPEQYTVTGNITKGSIDVTSATYHEALEIEITANAGHSLPESVTMTMGGASFTNFTYSDGTVSI